jgi:RNA 3'-terminal phosphate cyclase-like protein
VDRMHQSLVLLMMVLGSEDVGRVRMGEPTPKTYVCGRLCAIGNPFSTLACRIQFLRDVKTFFGTSFKITPVNASDEVCPNLLYVCYGTGYVNTNRTIA